MKTWKKLGLIYAPATEARHQKLLTHAANPLAVHVDGDLYRVFYSGRDRRNRSSIGAIDIDIVKRRIIKDYDEPFFQHGPEGSFYADGVSIGNCYVVQGIRYMLFMGWQTPSSGHWRGDIGRLSFRTDFSLEIDGDRPFMGADATDPISLSYPWVMENPSGGFEMWYGSTLTWDAGNNEMLHVINYATSMNGEHWKREGLAIPYELGKAQAFSRPAVVRNPGGEYEMWFSYRSGTGQTYRIGYADSSDGRKWKLCLAEAGIDVSGKGWDSEMIEYPFVFDHGGQRYMLYNGNGYGKTGFGLAVLSDA